MSNAAHLRGSAIWIRFPRVICGRWVHWQDLPDGRRVPIVLMGDARTAHFSIGSGTSWRWRMPSTWPESFAAGGSLQTVLQRYEDHRRVEVLKIQNAARNSTEWFEHVERYTAMEIEQFAYSLLTRSQRISHEPAPARPHLRAGGLRTLAGRARGAGGAGRPPTPPDATAGRCWPPAPSPTGRRTKCRAP